MKKLFLLLASAAIFGCNNNNNQTPQPQASFTGRWIPNWSAGDTLIGTVLDSNNAPIGYDTIYTGKAGDTSFITYNGSKIYVWNEPFTSTSFVDNQMLYGNCCISPTMSQSDAYSYNALTSASPSKYLDQSNQWSHQRQSLVINNYSHFKKVNGAAYSSQRIIQ